MKRLIILVLFLFIGFTTSCYKLNPEAKDVENAVRTYNAALVTAYLEADLGYVGHFISEDEFRKLYPLVLALQTTNSRMVAKQDYFKVHGIKIEGTNATLKAKEQWTYWWENRITGDLVRPKKVQEYKIIYKLKKQNGRWIIDALEPW